MLFAIEQQESLVMKVMILLNDLLQDLGDRIGSVLRAVLELFVVSRK